MFVLLLCLSSRKQAHVSAFVMLAALCKMATGMLRTLSDGELVARDLGNKVRSVVVHRTPTIVFESRLVLLRTPYAC